MSATYPDSARKPCDPAAIYCLVPPHREEEAMRRLRDAALPIRVILDRRRRERRGPERRALEKHEVDDDRRVILNELGRRVADRRSDAIPVGPQDLPASLQTMAAEFRFARAGPTVSSRQDHSIQSLRLIARMQAGDDAAFSELYGLWTRPLTRYFYSELRDATSVDDALQHVALALLTAAARYQIDARIPFQVWLFRIARNYVLNEVRRRRRLSVAAPSEMADLVQRSGEAHPTAALWAEWGIADMLKDLPPRQREVLERRFVLEMTTEEIAAALDITEAAIRQNESRALRRIRAALTDQDRVENVLRAPLRRRAAESRVCRARQLALSTQKGF